MTQYAVTNGSGVVLRLEETPAPDGSSLVLQPGEAPVLVATSATHWPTEPFPGATLNIDSGGVFSWTDTRSLAEAQADQVLVIRAAELAAELAGFTWSGDAFDSDAASQRRIANAMTCAVVAQRDAATMSIDWPLADGSYRTLDEDDLVALGQALHAHIAAQMATAQGLYADIAAATTNAAVDAIVWP